MLVSSESLNNSSITPFEDMEPLFKRYWEDINDYILATSNADYKALTKQLKRTASNYWLAKLAEKWQPLLDISPNRINQDIRDLKNTDDTSFISHLSLQDALQYYGTGAKWLIPNLLMMNGVMYILAGEPKVGKSILVNFLIYSVAVSGKFMGYPCKTGKVMYLQLEESLDTMGERLFYAGFGNLVDENTSLAVNFRPDLVDIYRDFSIADGCDWLHDLILEKEPTLVIVDTLRAASHDSDASENTGEFGKLVADLQRVFVRTNTCGLVVHHMSKKGGKSSNASIVDRLSGHTSIASNSAGIIGLFEETDKATNTRFLRMKTLPRSGTAIRIDYRLKTNSEGLWDLEKLDEDTPVENGHTNKIIWKLGTNPDTEFTQEEVKDYLRAELGGHYSDMSFNNSVQYLSATQIITKKFSRGRFRYFMPSESAWMVAPQELSGLVTQSVLDANTMVRCTSRRELKLLIDSWEDVRKGAAYSELDGKTKEAFKLKLGVLDYVVGDSVLYNGMTCSVADILIPEGEARLKLNSIQYKLLLESNGEFTDFIPEADLSPCEEASEAYDAGSELLDSTPPEQAVEDSDTDLADEDDDCIF